MIYLIKIIFFLLISNNTFAVDEKINEILFKINDKVFTNIDLEKRKKYIKVINNFESPKFTEEEEKEIQEDYISALVYYEFFLKKQIIFNNLNNEINTIYKKTFSNLKKLNENDVKNFKFNISIDLVRNKLIEREINLNQNILLKEVNTIDLLYNYNLKYIIVKEKKIDKEFLENITNRKEFNYFYNYLLKNKIDYFYKEEDINDNNIISGKIRKMIEQNISINIDIDNEYVKLVSINKNLESYEGIYVKLINFQSSKPFKKNDLECNNLKKTINADKTIFKEYEYSKLNNKIKNNLKTINDYVLFQDNDSYNYIILCDLRYDEKLLENINFNKNVNSLVKKLQINFLKKYKNEYKFRKIK